MRSTKNVVRELSPMALLCSGCLILEEPPLSVDRYEALRANDDFYELALSEASGCGLTTHGLTACWGHDPRTQEFFNPPDEDFLLLEGSTGEEALFCGVNSDDLIRCWSRGGGDSNPVLAGYEDPLDWTALAVGDRHACGLASDQIVRCWGDENGERLQVPDHEFRNIDSAAATTCGVDIDLHTQCWGTGDEDHDWLSSVQDHYAWEVALGRSFVCLGSPQGSSTAYTCYSDSNPSGVDVGVFDEVSATTAGDHHFCVVHSGQMVSCWGDNEHGQLDIDQEGEVWLRVSAGVSATCGINLEREINCWGDIPDPKEGPQ
jgi:hypothetical protein